MIDLFESLTERLVPAPAKNLTIELESSTVKLLTLLLNVIAPTPVPTGPWDPVNPISPLGPVGPCGPVGPSNPEPGGPSGP